MDYEIQRCTRRCAKTDRELGEGEPFYSALIAEGAEVHRHDYCVEAWTGPPEGKVLGWWKSRMPTREARRAQLAPNDVMLQLFEEMRDNPDRAHLLYLLALLLIRRRVFRLEETHTTDDGQEMLEVYCPRDEKNYQIPATNPSAEEMAQIQQELQALLFADAA